jgi:hypothetical protein
MQNANRPCSVELQLLSSLRHEKVCIECRIKNGNCDSIDSLTVVLKYMKNRIKEIEQRI